MPPLEINQSHYINASVRLDEPIAVQFTQYAAFTGASADDFVDKALDYVLSNDCDLADFLKTPQAKEELDELSALVKKSGPVCILCYERDHLHCHRQWIAEIIEERDGVRVENLVAPQV